MGELEEEVRCTAVGGAVGEVVMGWGGHGRRIGQRRESEGSVFRAEKAEGEVVVSFAGSLWRLWV